VFYILIAISVKPDGFVKSQMSILAQGCTTFFFIAGQDNYSSFQKIYTPCQFIKMAELFSAQQNIKSF